MCLHPNCCIWIHHKNKWLRDTATVLWIPYCSSLQVACSLQPLSIFEVMLVLLILAMQIACHKTNIFILLSYLYVCSKVLHFLGTCTKLQKRLIKIYLMYRYLISTFILMVDDFVVWIWMLGKYLVFLSWPSLGLYFFEGIFD